MAPPSLNRDQPVPAHRVENRGLLQLAFAIGTLEVDWSRVNFGMERLIGLSRSRRETNFRDSAVIGIVGAGFQALSRR